MSRNVPPFEPCASRCATCGPKRRDYSHLPAVEQVLELPPEQQRCSGCGQPLAPFPGTDDTTVLELNRTVYERLHCEKRLVVIPGATHLFEEPGALDQVARHAREWFEQHLVRQAIGGVHPGVPEVRF